MDCKDILQIFEHQRFGDWTGLATACTPEAISRHYHGDLDEFNTHWLGDNRVAASFTMLEMKAYEEPVALWFRNDRVVCLDVQYPELADVAGLLGKLGKPAAMLDYYFGVVLNAGGEWVYPDRGLTLYMRSDRETVLRIWAYAPMTLEAYMADLHHFEAPREQPLR